MENFLKKIKKSKKVGWIFLVIILLAIFLRTYNFSDWLRFNMDQSRDVMLMEKIQAENKLPQLGPKAGGTYFKLGPAFYYFQLAAAKIFGTHPDKLAYPDVFFSILSIGLLFLLAKIYFRDSIALAITGLYASSYFIVKYSRFAWNPNSTPFFVMLFIYALYNLAVAKERKILWAIIAGLALGICVQLHTSLLLILPVFATLALVFLLREKRIKKIAAGLVLTTVIFVNVPQIISETKTGGENIRNFITGAMKKNQKNDGLDKNLLLTLSCHIKASNFVLSSVGSEFDCDYKDELSSLKKIKKGKINFGQSAWFFLSIILSVVFFLGGYLILYKKIKREKNADKKIFLMLLLIYAALSFIFYIFWANDLAVRFFLPLAFLPFLMLGFWLNFISENVSRGKWIAIAIVAALLFLNVQKISETYHDLKYGGSEIGGNFSYLTWGEGKYIVDFIKRNTSQEVNYIDAQKGYLFKFFRPLNFLARKEGLRLVQTGKDVSLGSNGEFFYLCDAKNNCVLSDKLAKKYEVLHCENYRQFSIFNLKIK